MELRQIKASEAVVGFVCDVCQHPCCKELGPDRWHTTEVATLAADWGYWSNKDGTRHECHLCESCFDKVKAFVEHDLKGKVRVVETLSVSPHAVAGRDFLLIEPDR